MGGLSKTTRKKVVEILGGEKCKKYEDAIFAACERFSKNTGIPVKQVYPRIAYEIIGEIKSSKDPDVRKNILSSLESDKFFWSSSYYIEYQKAERKQDRKAQEKPKVVEGAFTCRDKTCGSKKCYFYQLQTRSADEPMTCFITCVKCGKRYTQG